MSITLKGMALCPDGWNATGVLDGPIYIIILNKQISTKSISFKDHYVVATQSLPPAAAAMTSYVGKRSSYGGGSD